MMVILVPENFCMACVQNWTPNSRKLLQYYVNSLMFHTLMTYVYSMYNIYALFMHNIFSIFHAPHITLMQAQRKQE